jgi:hypothetical protein
MDSHQKNDTALKIGSRNHQAFPSCSGLAKSRYILLEHEELEAGRKVAAASSAAAGASTLKR